MPSLIHIIIVSSNADQAGVETETGFATDTDLFLASDPAPRAKWGGWNATAYTTAQQASINAYITAHSGTSFSDAADAVFANQWRTDFPNSTFVNYNASTQRTKPADTLAALGLTTDPGT